MSAVGHDSANPADLSVYLVTDPRLVGDRSVVEVAVAAVAGGATAVQVREKDASARDFVDLVVRLSGAVGDRAAVIVNDRVDVFLAARDGGADVAGVHVGQSDLPVRSVRALVGEHALLGLSATHDDELTDRALVDAGVDYVGIGPVRATGTKTNAPDPIGLDGLAAAVGRCAVPAVAIGGLTAADAAGVRATGAVGLAVVSAVCAADDPRAAAAAIAEAWAGADR